MSTAPRHALTVDVEDWYQVSAFEDVVARERWDEYEDRVVANTTRMLDQFARHGVRATFFTLGWVAEKHPELVASIAKAGHEVASHGWAWPSPSRVASGSSTDEPTRAPVAAHWSMAGFQPLVS